MFWHTKSIKELMLELDTSVNGLSQEKAAQRLNESGKNQFESKKKKSFLKKLALCFWDKMTCILFIAAAVSYTVSRIAGESSIDAFIILAIVFLNGIVGAIQETKAEKSLEALKKLSSPETSVLRDGKKIRIPSCDTVCGDLIFLEKGCFVSADARVIESTALSTQESALTGEPNAVFKTSETLPQGDGHITSMHNIVWSGTSVVSGYGKAIVVATGMKSYVGTIAKMLDENETAKTPLQKKLAKTSGILGNAALLICLLIFIVSLLKGFAPAEMFLTGVSLAVAAIPEGLPAIVTIMLSFGVTKMVKRKAIVKKLPAVETLGCATVICSDKTGTLTQNKMKVSEIFGEQSITCSLFLLNNNFSSPTELALSEYAASHGADQKKIYAQNPRIAEIPFDSKTKLMATLHKTKTGYLAIIKGAPEIISCCIDDYPQNNGAEIMAKKALRVICVAYANLTTKPASLLDVRYTFAGMAGIFDPPRPEVKAAVADCKRAGIKPVMITGDHLDTAVAIAKQIGLFLPNGSAYTQTELEKLSPEEQSKAIVNCSVFARTTPQFKLKIVDEYQKHGDVVAMTGDGVNDAPALKKADIGCAMGICGTDVAKEACDIILTDDNFATIVGAVEYGRSIYANIRKAVHFLISCNIGEIFVVFAAIMLSLPAPLAAIQLLWVNLVTDSLPAIAFAFEKPARDIMSQKPIKKQNSLFSKGETLLMPLEGLLIGSLSLAAYFIGENSGGFVVGRTMSFAVLSLAQLFHSFNMKSRKPLFKGRSNPFLFVSFIVGSITQISVIASAKLANIFGVIPLDIREWGMVFVLSSIPLLIGEFIKFLRMVFLRRK